MVDNSCKPKHDLRNCPAMRALEHLTPGGSEFIDDIPRCVEHVRQARTQLMGILVEAKRKQRLADTMYSAVYHLLADLPARRDWLNPDLEHMLRDILREAGHVAV